MNADTDITPSITQAEFLDWDGLYPGETLQMPGLDTSVTVDALYDGLSFGAPG